MTLTEVEKVMDPYTPYESNSDKEVGYFLGSLNIDTFDECHIYFEADRVQSVRWTENVDGGKKPVVRWLVK